MNRNKKQLLRLKLLVTKNPLQPKLVATSHTDHVKGDPSKGGKYSEILGVDLYCIQSKLGTV